MTKTPPRNRAERKPRDKRRAAGGDRGAVGNRPTHYEDRDSKDRELGGDLRDNEASEKTGYGSYGEVPERQE
jgi:hypothetical protein